MLGLSQRPFITKGREPCPQLAAPCLHASGDGKLTSLQGFQTRPPCMWPWVRAKLCLTWGGLPKSGRNGTQGRRACHGFNYIIEIHTLQFIHLKCMTHLFYYIHKVMCPSTQSILEHFHPS